jgi:hypothetical protein
MVMRYRSISGLRRPSVHAALRGIAIAVSLSVTAPVLAASQTGQRKPAADRKAQTGVNARKPAAVARTKAPEAMAPTAVTSGEPLPADIASVTPPTAAMVDTTPPAVVPSPQATQLPKDAASGQAAPPPVNPYLAGWFRPTPVSQLPVLAAQQLGASTQWAIQSVVGLPRQVVDALPSIKRVFPTGGRELWVVNAKCPAEMVTGQYFFPANALRDVVNGLLGTLNESQLLTFDIQLVCS